MRERKTEYYLFAFLLLVIVLGLVGWAFSPLDSEGRPILLLPDVKKVEDYRKKIGGWAGTM